MTDIVAQTCRYCGISRPTFYKWRNRDNPVRQIHDRLELLSSGPANETRHDGFIGMHVDISPFRRYPLVRMGILGSGGGT